MKILEPVSYTHLDVYKRQSDACGQAANVYYPNKVDVTDERSFKKAVSFDHVAASYKNNYRSNVNFIESDHISMDCEMCIRDSFDFWQYFSRKKRKNV